MPMRALPPGSPIPDDALYEVVNGQIMIPTEEMPGNGLDSDTLYEVVNGQIVACPPMGAFEVDRTSQLHAYLSHFALEKRLGRVEMEMMFTLDASISLRRRPDIAFVSYGRWPRKQKVPSTEAWDVIPELAIEVISPSNTATEIQIKIGEYFRAGCQRVWVVYPVQELIYVYQSPTKNTILTRQDELEGEDILPGFRLFIAKLFGEDEP